MRHALAPAPFWRLLMLLAGLFTQLLNLSTLFAQPAEVARFALFERTVQRSRNLPANPFTDATLTGVFRHESGQETAVTGFCDAPDGRLFRIRFMPTQAGAYTYTLTYQQAGKTERQTGRFVARDAGVRGPVRVDPQHPWHFVYDGTGEHFFWNATTTYWLLGWKDEAVIRQALDRLARLKINRIRVAINGRQDDGSRWAEPMVKESAGFTFKLNPWVAARPESLDDPGFDVTRFNLPHWQRIDRVVQYARDRGIQVSIVFYVDGLEHGADPFKKTNMGNADERRYYAYAAARLAAFPNIMWDITNEYHLFRSEEWVKQMGPFLRGLDANRHLMSVHGHADFPFRTTDWVDMALYQSWDECGGYEFLTDCRARQVKTGRIIPQINEEYGYEDHYPTWGCGPTGQKFRPGRSADNRRRLAWEMYMAGGYQTTGERADDGTGAGPDAGGGWINGRGNDRMTMLHQYAHIVDVFTSLPWWTLEPRNDVVNLGNLCLAQPGRLYLVYSRMPMCRVALEKGRYAVQMINARTGERSELPDVDGNAWQYPRELDDDWAFILTRR